MADLRAKYSSGFKRKILELQHNKCFWCGDYIDIFHEEFTLEHVVPMATYGLTKDYYNDRENTEFLNRLRSKENIVVAHSCCNNDKAIQLVAPSLVKSMSIEVGCSMDRCLHMYDKYSDRLDTYNYILTKKCKEQNNKCKVCGRKISKDNVVIRGTTKKFCVCSKCNQSIVKDDFKLL